eukprot:c52915_g1_i1.p1 GENE.c52915_g1_i1~~c52915_g1_i1.p1  ORF type:complete len:388 (+),score=35.02 c52915_g1_i1:93-1166(+)
MGQTGSVDVDQGDVFFHGRQLTFESRRKATELVEHQLAALIYCSYRRGFPEIGDSGLVSDTGWGCMHRAGQMLLANALLRSFESRRAGPASPQEYWMVISWFADACAVEAPYSLHNLATIGALCHGTAIGSWFGPATVASVLKSLVCRHAPNMAIHVASDATLYLDQLAETSLGTAPGDSEALPGVAVGPFFTDKAAVAGEWRPTLIVVPLRLGIDRLSAEYVPQLLLAFAQPEFAGMVGGRPNSAYYFVAAQGERLLYLDPHVTQTAVRAVDAGDASSYRARSLKALHIGDVDPSLALAFFCASPESMEAFCARAGPLFRSHPHPLFTVADRFVRYEAPADAGVIALSSDEDFELV